MLAPDVYRGQCETRPNNGALRSKSQRVSRRRRHQTISSSTSGKMATEPLLSMASTKAAKLSQ